MREVIFIHVPRTGGMSIRQLGWVPSCGHSTAMQIRCAIGEQKFSEAFKFAFVRNPYDRFVSLYHFFSQITEDYVYYEVNKEASNRIKSYRNFGEFCLAFERDGIGGYYHFFPQLAFVADYNGNNAMNYLGRFESIDSDLQLVSKEIGRFTYELPHINSSKHSAWHRMYSARSAAAVAQFYHQDFEKLGYSLEIK